MSSLVSGTANSPEGLTRRWRAHPLLAPLLDCDGALHALVREIRHRPGVDTRTHGGDYPICQATAWQSRASEGQLREG
jgi:hypothetical protein